MNKYMEEFIVLNADKKVKGVTKACWLDSNRTTHSVDLL